MITHADLWRGIDALAASLGLSVSGLAKRAGLDPTTFNPSKRLLPDGRARWPGTESLAKVLDAVHLDLATFARFIPLSAEGGAGGKATMPKRLLERTAVVGLFGSGGLPDPDHWGQIDLPIAVSPDLYVLELIDNVLAPIYRRGDKIVVSCVAPVRLGDRVCVYTAAGRFLLRHLVRLDGQAVDLAELGFGAPTRLIDKAHLQSLHRIVMVTQ